MTRQPFFSKKNAAMKSAWRVHWIFFALCVFPSLICVSLHVCASFIIFWKFFFCFSFVFLFYVFFHTFLKLVAHIYCVCLCFIVSVLFVFFSVLGIVLLFQQARRKENTRLVCLLSVRPSVTQVSRTNGQNHVYPFAK